MPHSCNLPREWLDGPGNMQASLQHFHPLNTQMGVKSIDGTCWSGAVSLSTQRDR